MLVKRRLPYVLKQIHTRYCSIFFSKLVLLDFQSQSNGEEVRHYDIQCQAVEMMFGTLITKVKALELKTFQLIKDQFSMQHNIFEEKHKIVENNSNDGYKKKVLPDQNKIVRNIPNSYKLSDKQSTTRNLKDLQLSSDESLSTLMLKVRNLQNQDQVKNKQFSDQDPESVAYNQKIEKRRLILTKIAQLQNDVTDLLQDDKNQSQGYYLSHSAVNQNDQIYQGPSKSRRSIHKTFTSRNEIKRKNRRLDFIQNYN